MSVISTILTSIAKRMERLASAVQTRFIQVGNAHDGKCLGGEWAYWVMAFTVCSLLFYSSPLSQVV